ncbi:MAG: BatD family protein, partial [bacterium]
GPGEKTLEPMTIECDIQVPRRRRRGRDIFDSFFDDPFFRRTERIAVQSNAVTIDVRPLPDQGKPSNFSGAIGDFAITSSIDKQKVKSNEAITLKVKVSGTGNIRIIPTPEIDFPADFEVYDPKIRENIKRNSRSISGSKTFEYVIIPRFPGAETIKGISFSYFDLSSETYKTVTTGSIDISVTKGEDQFVSVGIGNTKEDVKFIGKDIRFIKTRVPEFQRAGNVFYKQVYFYILLIVPLIALAGAFGYRLHLEKLSSNVAYARSRKANQMALKRLRDAQKAMKNGNQANFYAEVSKALMGFIGDKLNVSSAGLITDEVEKMLNQHHINGETVSGYISCLQTCDYKRFAPSGSNEIEMKDFFEKARDAIVKLEKMI